MLDYQRVKPLNTRVSSNGCMESQSSNTCWTAGRGYFHWSSVLEDRSTCFTASMYMCLIHLDLVFLEIEGAIYLQLLLNSLRWRWRERYTKPDDSSRSYLKVQSAHFSHRISASSTCPQSTVICWRLYLLGLRHCKVQLPIRESPSSITNARVPFGFPLLC